MHIHKAIKVRVTKDVGRGVFAIEDIPAGIRVETAPVIVLPKSQTKFVNRTLMEDYVFDWSGDRRAIALGYVSLYNHSSNANAKFVRNEKSKTMSVLTIRPVKKGGQILIDYTAGKFEMDWFKVKELR